jgi:hypothetical protein
LFLDDMMLNDRQRSRAGRTLLTLGLLILFLSEPALGQGPPAPIVQPEAVVRPPVVVGLPVPQISSSGELFMQPNVGAGGIQVAAAQQEAESLPPPSGVLHWPGGTVSGENSSGILGLPGGLLNGDPSDLWFGCEPLIPWQECKEWIDHPVSPTGEPGLGRERVMYAPFEIDISQPFGNFLLRFDAAYNLTKPDRAEFFWAQPGRGPILPERSVSFQDYRFRMENGNETFSLATEVPVRFVNPEVNGNNGGVGDIQLVQKTVLMNGGRWQLTQLLRTVFNSGNARKGLGTGHTAMEPGLLCRFKYSELTYLHSEWKLMFPLGGTPMYSGPAFKWGVGVSTLWYETDTMAFIPTLEFMNIWILDGLVIPPGGGAPVDVKGDAIFNLAPGLRTVWDTGGDLGVVEMGASAICAVGSNGWYDALVRFDLRFVF